MNPVAFIRSSVFNCENYREFAVVLGENPMNTFRWERAGRFPHRAMVKVRKLAVAQGRGWNDQWFFEVPTPRDDAETA